MPASSGVQQQDRRAVLLVEDLAVEYRRQGGLLSPRRRPVRAVDGVDLVMCCGETLGVVGESGCGKTTLGRALVRLVAPVRGRIVVDGTDILALRGEALRHFRPNIQMIFQNPASSLDPRMRVFDLVAEPLRAHFRLNSAALTARIRESLEQVGIYESQWDRYPSALSGGQAQRVAIARVLAMDPRIVVLDEPTSALDVSVQAQVVNLLRRLQRELQLTYLFISHDLALVDHLSDRIAVMYLGQVVEIAERTEILNAPRHPYTQALLSASPVPDPDRKRGRIMLGGTVPDVAAPPPGCRFHPRCPAAVADCQHVAPRLVAVSDTHWVACILSDDRQG